MTRLAAAACALLVWLPQPAPAQDAATLWRVQERKAGSYAFETRHRDAGRKPRHINALIGEHSPYLLQHAHNPVHWQAWGDAALDAARTSNRLIFLSIGYSTCHWCHVMARESFDSEHIAGLLNADFVSIMVDREERPDLDEFFLARMELLSGSPGWPMTLVLTPQGKLFAAASYMDEASLAAHLQRMAGVWRERPQQVERMASAIAAKFAPLAAAPPRPLDRASLCASALDGVRQQYDPAQHGFGRAPRFTHAPMLQMLLEAFRRDAAPADRDKVLATLRALAGSALHDPVDGGFFRYSLTADWQTPHFEKMLYDQALLARLLAEAWALSGDPMFARASASTLAFVHRHMRRSDGLFFSAWDAESDGRPGAYYLWHAQDLATSLDGAAKATLASQFRSLPQPGGGLLLLPRPGADGPVFDALLARLSALRQRRQAPFVDHKAITGWNALMIEALARSGDLLGERRHIAQAGSAMRRLLELHVRTSGITRYSTGQAAHGEASLEDIGHLLAALAALHDADGDLAWHAEALRLVRLTRSLRDDEEGLRLFARDRELPSATAALARALDSLHLQSGEPKFREALRSLSPTVDRILVGDGVEGRASLACAAQAGQRPLPRQRARLARGHVRAELTADPADPARFALALHIDPGWHVNSHRPVQDYLVPLRLASPTGAVVSVAYPAGKLTRLGFEKSALSIHEGSTTIRGSFTDYQPQGQRSPALSLTLQACTDRVCLPPESVLLESLQR